LVVGHFSANHKSFKIFLKLNKPTFAASKERIKQFNGIISRIRLAAGVIICY
jgi:hypothetical protein